MFLVVSRDPPARPQSLCPGLHCLQEAESGNLFP